MIDYYRFDIPAEQEALAEVYTYLCPLYNAPVVHGVLPARIRAFA
jgi:hypothetical protein